MIIRNHQKQMNLKVIMQPRLLQIPVTGLRTRQIKKKTANKEKIVAGSSSSVSSLLSVLRTPRLSDLTRKRKVQANSGKKTCFSSLANSDPKGIKPQD